MSVVHRQKGLLQTQFLPEFQPLSALWEGTDPPYPSEFSARWALRKMRTPLAQASAVAIHRGRVFVHPQRFADVAEKDAIAAFTGRVNGLNGDF